MFSKLYENIVTGNVLDEDMNLLSVQERMKIKKCMSWYHSLVQNGVITVLCDAYPIKCPNVLRITKTDNEIILEFEKYDGKNPKAPHCISIDIRSLAQEFMSFVFLLKASLNNYKISKRKK